MITIQLIKKAVEKNFILSKQGEGPIPVDLQVEDNKHSGNSCFLFLMEKYRFNDIEIGREMDELSSVQMNRVRKLMKQLILDEDERFINKLTLAENYIKLNKSTYHV